MGSLHKFTQEQYLNLISTASSPTQRAKGINISNSKIKIDNATINANNSKITGENLIVHGNNNKITGTVVSLKGNNNKVSGDVDSLYGNNNKVDGTVKDFKGNNNKIKNNVSDFNLDDCFDDDLGIGGHPYSCYNNGSSIPVTPKSQLIREGQKPLPLSPPEPRIIKEPGLFEGVFMYLLIFMCYVKYVAYMGLMSPSELRSEIKEIKKLFNSKDKKVNFDRSVFFDDEIHKAVSKKKNDPSMNYPGYEGGYVFFLWYKMLEEGKKDIAESIEKYIKENDLVIDLDLMDEAPLLHEKIR